MTEKWHLRLYSLAVPYFRHYLDTVRPQLGVRAGGVNLPNAFIFAVQGFRTMRKIALFAAASAAALTLAACSEATEDSAEATADEAVADAETNMEAIEAETDEAIADVTAEADEAAAEVEAAAENETTAEAAAD
ncbi:hypothetical protein WKH79_12330 [Qipengyuania sp. GPGPB31]